MSETNVGNDLTSMDQGYLCPTIYGYVSPLTYRTLGSETPR